MFKTIKIILKIFNIDKIYFFLADYYSSRKQYLKWHIHGKKEIHPQLFKQNQIRKLARKYNIKTLIETGTFFGDTVNALKKSFQNIYTIELDFQLCQLAQKRFERYSHIQCINGDSGKVLPEILKKVNEACIFWLDGHYSGGVTAKGDSDTPIVKELETILSHNIKEHIILIDDARLFNGTNDYPTISELEKMIIGSGKTIEVKNDIMRIT